MDAFRRQDDDGTECQGKHHERCMRPVQEQGRAGYPEHDHRACHRRRRSDDVQVGTGEQAGGSPGPEGAHRTAEHRGDERRQDAYVLPGQGQDVGAAGLAEVLGDRGIQIVANTGDQGLQQWARGSTAPMQRVDHGRSDAPACPLMRRRRGYHGNVATIDKGERGGERIGPCASTAAGRHDRPAQRDRYRLAAHQRGRHGTANVQEQWSTGRHARAITAMHGKELDGYGGLAGGGAPGIGGDVAITGHDGCRSGQARCGPAGDRLDAGMGAASGEQAERQGDQQAAARADAHRGQGGRRGEQRGAHGNRNDAGAHAGLQVCRDGRSDGEWNCRRRRRIGSGHGTRTPPQAPPLAILPAKLLQCVPGCLLDRFRVLEVADIQ